MDADQFFTEIKRLTDHRANLLREAGTDFNVLNSETSFKGHLTDAGDYAMFAADARLNPGDIVESRGQKFLVSNLEDKPGCRIAKTDAIKAEHEIFSEVKTAAGTALKAHGKLAVLDNDGGVLTVQKKQLLPLGSIVKVGVHHRIVVKVLGHARLELAKLATEPYTPNGKPVTLKMPERPDWTKGAPGVLPVRGKAF